MTESRDVGTGDSGDARVWIGAEEPHLQAHPSDSEGGLASCLFQTEAEVRFLWHFELY